MDEVLGTLEPIESYVIRMRFNSDWESRPTLEKIGEYFGVTRERVRQIEGKARRKMVHPMRSELLFKQFNQSLIENYKKP